MSWKWTRAMWIENGEEMEGVVPTAWIEEENLRWPNKSYKNSLANRRLPSTNWLSYPIIKKKLCNGEYSVFYLI